MDVAAGVRGWTDRRGGGGVRMASKHMGEEQAMDYFRMVAETSASLAEPLD